MELDKALEMLTEFSEERVVSNGDGQRTLQINEAQSLLEKCADIVASGKQRPKLRLIHHFACTGGTLFSKCIASQPNVFMMSEVHPTTRLGWSSNEGDFIPRDIISNLMRAGVPAISNLSEKVFERSIRYASKHVEQFGGTLVIRAHSHSDYCTSESVPSRDSLSRILSDKFRLINLVTIRDPIDSYLSIQRNKWVHFSPKTFDEYCRRLLVFLKPFDKNHIFKYEDFVLEPEKVMKKICSHLEITFVKESLDIFGIVTLSGDSGRQSNEIGLRSRPELSEAFQDEITSSQNYKIIKKEFNY